MNREQILDILTNRVANSALEVTPIICSPNPPSAIPLGCGIFLKIQNDYYLLSAGHLLNIRDWPDLMVPGNNDRMVWLNGKIITTYNDPSTANEIDFGILQFSPRQIKHLINGQLAFINPENIIVNHKVEKGGYYVVAGYPVSGIKKAAGKAEFTPIPVKFLTYPVENKRHKKFNPNHFILVRYQRRLAPFGSKKKVITKELKGISGSGLWYIPNWNDRKTGIPKFYLVGIMVENYKDQGYLVALRIDFITDTINKIFNSPSFDYSRFNFENKLATVFGSEIP